MFTIFLHPVVECVIIGCSDTKVLSLQRPFHGLLNLVYAFFVVLSHLSVSSSLFGRLWLCLDARIHGCCTLVRPPASNWPVCTPTPRVQNAVSDRFEPGRFSETPEESPVGAALHAEGNAERQRCRPAAQSDGTVEGGSGHALRSPAFEKHCAVCLHPESV